MTDPDVRFNQLIAALKVRDFRLTPQRVELVRLIAVSEGHPSASHRKRCGSWSRRLVTRSSVLKFLFMGFVRIV
jgi:hypothetical protein